MADLLGLNSLIVYNHNTGNNILSSVTRLVIF